MDCKAVWIYRYQGFGETHNVCIFNPKDGNLCFLKLWYLSASPNNTVTHKTNINNEQFGYIKRVGFID